MSVGAAGGTADIYSLIVTAKLNKLSPARSGAFEEPIFGGFSAESLGLQSRNDTGNLSLNRLFSPRLGSWPI